MTTRKSKFWLYRRYSSKPQERGDSIRRQTALAEAWAARTGNALDLSLPVDDGVSAFKGANRKDGSLGEFLRMIERGEVLPGDVLLAENLDRLSRENPWDSIPLLCGVVNAGVAVQTLSPEMTYKRGTDLAPLILGVVELCRSNGDSVLKSDRISSDKEEQRRREREEGLLGTFALPPWVRAGGDGKAELIPEKAAVARTVFRLAREGLGLTQIVNRMTAEGVPPLPRVGEKLDGRKPRGVKWSRTTVRRVLTDRVAIGEATRYKGRKRDRQFVQVVPGLYPPIVTPAEFHAAQTGMQKRKEENGGQNRKRSSRFPNPFQGLLKDARTGATYITQARKEKTGRRHHVLQVAETGKWSFPFEVLEKALLTMVREIKPEEVTDGFRPDELKGLQGERDATAKRLAEMEDAATRADGGEAAFLARAAAKLEAKHKQLSDAIEEMERKAATPASSALREARSLLDAYLNAEDKADACARLRAALRRCFSGVWILVANRGVERFADVQVCFRDSDAVRHVAIYVRPPRGNNHGSKPGLWWAMGRKSFLAGGGVDLSNLTTQQAQEQADAFPEWVDLAMAHSMAGDGEHATGPTVWADAYGRAVWGEIQP